MSDHEAEVAALRRELAEATGDLGDTRSRLTALISRATGNAPQAPTREAVDEASRVVLTLRRENETLRARVTDLEARAIPAAWATARQLVITMERDDYTGARIVASNLRPGDVELCDITEMEEHHNNRTFPTLAAALRAASENT